MAFWQILAGFGIGIIVSIVAIVATSKQKEISYEESNYISPPGESCAICLSEMSEKDMKYLNCGHAYHESCLLKAKQNRVKTCPVCRRSL